MMTPSELRDHEFKGAGRNAYKADDVDAFFGDVSVAYEKIYRENAELIKRMSLLADKLEQFKQDENDIKQAVLGAQKAADLIIKEAESSVENSKSEAEAILAAAKGEADIIKSDAEKQAIADSDLLLSIARDKAEDILNKAKEEAHGILIAANDSASDTVGAATRTITSESIHYDMLKKEVSDFRASILAQYKAHIELISKLPEIALEEASKIETETTEQEQKKDDVPESAEYINNDEVIEYTDETFDEYESDSKDNTPVCEPNTDDSQVNFDISDDDNSNTDNSVDLSNTDNALDEDEEKNGEVLSEPSDIPISRGFNFDVSKVSADDLMSFDDTDNTQQNNDETVPGTSLFDSIEKIESNGIVLDDDDEDDDNDDGEKNTKSHHGFFRRKK